MVNSNFYEVQKATIRSMKTMTIVQRKNNLSIYEIIGKDNDFIYHEDVDAEVTDYMGILTKKVVPLNSNRI